jgi:general secretion pathway protein I
MAGFTLIELLVALALLALAFGYGYRAISDELQRLDTSRQQGAATALAEAMLTRVGHDIALQVGSINGRTAEGFAWRIDIASYADPTRPSQAPLAGYQVAVTIDWTDRHRGRELRLTSLRLGPQVQGS